MNYLVYRYLLESGFTHAAFALGTESRPGKPEREIPPGALISFVQKGLQYLELEANLNDVRAVTRWIVYFSFRFVSLRRTSSRGCVRRDTRGWFGHVDRSIHACIREGN